MNLEKALSGYLQRKKLIVRGTLLSSNSRGYPKTEFIMSLLPVNHGLLNNHLPEHKRRIVGALIENVSLPK